MGTTDKAIAAEFSKIRAIAARIPDTHPSYARALEIIGNLRTITSAHETLSFHEAYTLTRKTREDLEKLLGE